MGQRLWVKSLAETSNAARMRRVASRIIVQLIDVTPNRVPASWRSMVANGNAGLSAPLQPGCHRGECLEHRSLSREASSSGVEAALGDSSLEGSMTSVSETEMPRLQISRLELCGDLIGLGWKNHQNGSSAFSTWEIMMILT
jgi:hypothetical protein